MPTYPIWGGWALSPILPVVGMPWPKCVIPPVEGTKEANASMECEISDFGTGGPENALGNGINFFLGQGGL